MSQVAEKDSVGTVAQKVQRGSGKGKVYAHSLAWPENFGNLPQHFTAKSIEEYWKTHSYNGAFEYITFGEKVIDSCLDVKELTKFALDPIVDELHQTVVDDQIVYVFESCNLKVDFRKILIKVIEIGHIVTRNSTTLGIAQYKKICEILSDLTSDDRNYTVRVIERYINSTLTHLASTVNVTNLKYVLGKLKLNNSVALIHQIFCSPTITGKITGIYRLLELHEFTMNMCDWCSLDSLAKFLYHVWSWVMEKTELAKEFLANGFKWNKAADWVEDPQDIMNQIAINGEVKKNEAVLNLTDLIPRIDKEKIPDHPVSVVCRVCKEKAYIGCALCGMHICEKCKPDSQVICPCKNSAIFYHTNDTCNCGIPLDCWWDAVSCALNASPVNVKRHVWNWLNSVNAEDVYNDLMDMYGVKEQYLSFPEFSYQVILSLYRGKICEAGVCGIVTALAFHGAVQMYDLTTELSYAVQFGKPKIYITIDWDPSGCGHFSVSDSPPTDTPTLYFWGSKFEGWRDATKQLHISHIRKLESQYRKWESLAAKWEELCEKNQLDSEWSSIVSGKRPPMKQIEQIVKDNPILETAMSASDIASEQCSLFGSETSDESGVSSLLSDLVSNFKSFTPTDVQSTIGVETKPKDEKLTQDEIDNLINTAREGDFLHLLKTFQWCKVGRYILDWFKNSSKDVLQFFEDNKIIGSIVALVMGLASFIGINVGIFSEGKSARFLAKFATAQRTMYYTERSFGTLGKTLNDTLDVAREILGVSIYPEIDQFRDEVAAALKLAREMQEQASHRPGEFVNSSHNFEKFARQYESLSKTYDKLARFKDAKLLSTLTPIWISLNTVYHSLSTVYGKIKASISTRQETTCIYIWGDTNIGKTHMAEAICSRINEATGWELEVFTISKGTDFWNNYVQQGIIRVDDMNAVVNTEHDKDSEVIYNICSAAPYNPSLAAVEDKSIMCNAKFLIVCSNHPTVPSNSVITYRHAWERRRDVFVHASWPEHEKCPRGTVNCAHIKARDARTHELNGKSDYSHLELRICNASVSYESNEPRPHQKLPHNQKTSWEVLANEQIDETGVIVDIETIVKGALYCEAKYRQKYLDKLKSSPLKINQAMSWKKSPFVMLVGPPGTGKSFILQRVVERFNSTTLVIKTAEQFKDYVAKKCISDDARLIVINDLSLHLQQPEFKNFVDYISSTYDDGEVPQHLLVVGCNEAYASQKLNEMGGEDLRRLFFRRFNQIRCQFKEVPHVNVKKMFNMLPGIKKKTIFNEEDVARHPEKLPDYVGYYYEKELVSQETVVTLISAYQPELVEVKLRNALPTRENIKLDTAITFNMETTKFLEMVNDCSATDILSFITQGKCKSYSKKEGLKMNEVGKMLFKMIKDAGDLKGTKIFGLDDLLLQAWNRGLLSSFKGHVLVLHFVDKMYYIDATEEIECGILKSKLEDIKDFIDKTEMLEEVVTMQMVFDENCNFLPHWAILAGEIFSTVLATASTAVSSVLTVMDQHELFKAQEEALHFNAMFKEAVAKVKEDTNQFIGESINLASPYNASKLVPGISKYHADQYSIEEEDPITEADGETPPDKKNGQGGKRSRYRTVRMNRKYQNEPVKEYLDHTINPEYKKSLPQFEEVKYQCSGDRTVKTDIINQVSRDPATKSIVDKLLKNVCEIHTVSGVRLCSGLFVRGRIVRTVSHILDGMSVHNIRVFTQEGKAFECEVVKENELLHRLDLRVTDPLCPQYADITTHFPDSTSIIRDNTHALLVTPRIDPKDGKLVIIFRPMLVTNCGYRKWTDSTSNLTWMYKGHRIGVLATGSQTDDGDCGSLLIACDPTIQTGKVIGMHFCATPENAHASLLIRNQYDERPKFQSMPVKESQSIMPESDPEVPTIVGFVNEKIFTPSKTHLYRNWYPVGPELYEPSVLTSKDPRGPPKEILYEECDKWLQPEKPVPSELKDTAHRVAQEIAHWTADILQAEGVQLRKLTSKEALNKVREFDKSEPINLHTSPGYPFSKMTKKQGKTDFLQLDREGVRHFNKSNPQLISALQTRIAHLENPDIDPATQPTAVIFQIFLKDELVKKKKIYTDAKKTRTIGAVGLDFLIAYRKYFHAAQAAMMDHWFKLFIAVGINPLSLDWHDLYTKLVRNSVFGCDLDFKDWDFSHPKFFWDMFVDFWIILYERLDPSCTLRETQTRKKLYFFLQNCLILVGNELHKMVRGLPSGYPGTSIDGSIANFIMLVTAWVTLAKKKNPKVASFSCFREDVCATFYSDDFWISIAQYCAPWFNGETISEIYRDFGFNPQTAAKEGEIVPYKPLDQCTFLSREMKYWNGFWIGPLKEDNLNKSTHFCSDRKSHYFWESPNEKCESLDIVQSCYMSVLYNAALHGAEFYEKYRLIYNKVSLPYGGESAPSWRDIMSQMFPIGKDLDIPKGLTLMKFPEILTDWHHSLPKNFKAMKDRTSYHFGPQYTYTGGPETNKIPQHLIAVLELVNKKFKRRFNSILVNKYPQGGKIPWHKDTEPELDVNEGVLGVTVKGDGRIHFKNANNTYAFYQNVGSAYYMNAENLKSYYHMRDSHTMETISLTFRRIVPRPSEDFTIA